MNINLNNFKKSFTKAAKKTKETSETVVEMAKIKYKLIEIKSDIDDKYLEIGKLVYNSSENEDITDKLKEICEGITELTEKKDDLQNTYNDLVSKKYCPKCDMKLDKDFTFCPKCGHNFEE